IVPCECGVTYTHPYHGITSLPQPFTELPPGLTDREGIVTELDVVLLLEYLNEVCYPWEAEVRAPYRLCVRADTVGCALTDYLTITYYIHPVSIQWCHVNVMG